MKARLKIAFLVLVMFCTTTLLVAMNQKRVGIARDEVIYMSYGSRYVEWWDKFIKDEPGASSPKVIESKFGGRNATDNNREHPPLMKVLFGVSKKLLHDRYGLMDELSAYRFPNALLYGALAVLVFLYASSLFGSAGGFLAAFLAVALPRGVFHASLACFDAPVMTFWFATLVAYLFALKRRWGFLLLGIVFGLTLATKHNAIMIPIVLSVHWLWLVVHRKRQNPQTSLWGVFESLNPQVWIGLLVVGPMVLVACWPWLWFEPFAHVSDWIGFHLRHVHYNYEYLGSNLNAPPFPWHVPLVTTFLVIPSATLAASVLGVCSAWICRRQPIWSDPLGRAPLLLLFLSAGVAMGPFFLGSTPIFGAEKHWMAAIPSIAIFAVLGALFSIRSAQRMLSSRDAHGQWGILGALLATSLVVTTGYETWIGNPYALTHYVGLAGGAPGGADLGMNRQFWGYSARGVLPYLNESIHKEDRNAKIYTHDASVAWPWYQRLGLLDKRFRDSGHEDAGIKHSDYAIVIHEKHFNRHDYKIWESYKTTKPVFVLTEKGVPIVSVYKRKNKSTKK